MEKVYKNFAIVLLLLLLPIFSFAFEASRLIKPIGLGFANDGCLQAYWSCEYSTRSFYWLSLIGLYYPTASDNYFGLNLGLGTSSDNPFCGTSYTGMVWHTVPSQRFCYNPLTQTASSITNDSCITRAEIEAMSCFGQTLDTSDIFRYLTITCNNPDQCGGSTVLDSIEFPYTGAEIAPTISEKYPNSLTTTTFNLSNYNTFFSGSYSYESSLAQYDSISLIMTGVGSTTAVCTSTTPITGLTGSFYVAPNCIDGTFSHHYIFNGTNKRTFEGIYYRYPTSTELGGNVVFVSSTSAYFSTSSTQWIKEDCASISWFVSSTQRAWCESKNTMIDWILPSVSIDQRIQNFNSLVKSKVPFVYITAFSEFLTTISNVPSTSTSKIDLSFGSTTLILDFLQASSTNITVGSTTYKIFEFFKVIISFALTISFVFACKAGLEWLMESV